MNLKTLTLAAFMSTACIGAANAAPCTVGTCDVTDSGPLSDTNPKAIQDDDVEVGEYNASGSFDIASDVVGANVFADVAFDEVLPGQSAVAAGFSSLTIDFSQDGTSLGSYLITNPDGTTEGGSALQSFVLNFISSSAVDFSITGMAFLNSGAALPDFNFNIDAVSEVPLPAALPLFFAGLGGLGFAANRKKKQAAAA